MMASIDIRYNCGCGFRSKTLEAATAHSDGSSHVITVQGNIYPDKAPEPTRSRKTVTPAVEVVEETGPIVDFAAMKRRLHKPQA